MKFTKYLHQRIKPIQKTIQKALTEWEKPIIKKTPKLNLTELLKASNQGGKHIRGVLVCLGYELYANKKSIDLYKVAAAYEILHTSLLIHDDVIDKSILRRNKPTIYQRLGGNHYGISQAICLGDVGFFLSMQLINQTNFAQSIKSAVAEQFVKLALDTLWGEMLDVEDAHKDHRSEKNTLLIHELKTAQYTIVGPLLIGAILSGKVSKTQSNYLIQFGKYLGIAYQIQDDILGVFGQEKVIGKSVASDIEEGKNTLLIARALKVANAKQKKTLEQYYGKSHLNAQTCAEIKNIFTQTGALDYSRQKVEEYVNQARKYISLIVQTTEMKDFLYDFVDYINLREK